MLQVMIRILYFAVAAGLLTACGGDNRDQWIRLSGPTMGTQYTVKLSAPTVDLKSGMLQTGIEAILENVNDQMSTYRSDSELSRFNQSPTTDWVSVSAELLEVFETAYQVSELTGGAFDITVGPLVNLWGFGPEKQNNRVPSKLELSEALRKVGYAKISTRRFPPAIKKDDQNIYVDLSAIAKGYAVDKVAEYLESYGVNDYLIEIGGDLRTKGQNANGTPWVIAVEKPATAERTIQRKIYVQDQAMATSGDYRNFFEGNGRRFSHAIDPANGTPVAHNLASVTVLNPSAMHADALATALLVLGPEDGYTLAMQQQLYAYFIIKTMDGYAEKSTPRFDQSVGRASN